MPTAATMTCPHCRRAGVAVTYKTIQGARVRVPVRHKARGEDGTLTADWCQQGQPTRRDAR